MDTAWLDERIAKTKTLIVAYEDAILALASGAQTYQLDTGQTRQMVVRANLAHLQSVHSSLLTQLASYEARRYGVAVIARPGF